ncbi:hypothetical protein [Pseudomonas putida]|uniref:Uncharacterized protein n=1 Tax=Pseudomonas putida TaxID=303 RepID=A0A8I1ECG5_PSEPU|nr:hypothetical protein [Pseudomonas putida]MBI6882738.1 hypothetical protein [Pseudomonas putida]
MRQSKKISIKRWSNYCKLQRTISMLKKDYPNPTGYLRPYYYEDFSELDANDPGLKKFVKLLGENRWLEFRRMDDLVSAIKEAFSLNIESKGISGYDQKTCDAVDSLMRMQKKQGAWLHLDRFFNHVTGMPLSKIFEKSIFAYDKEDPGLDGDLCYSVSVRLLEGVEKKPSTPPVRYAAIASSPYILTKMITEACQIALDSRHDVTRVYSVVFVKNGNPICSIQLSGRIDENQERELDFHTLRWEGRDSEMMKAIYKIAPESLQLKLKSEYVSDELGL